MSEVAFEEEAQAEQPLTQESDTSPAEETEAKGEKPAESSEDYFQSFISEQNLGEESDSGDGEDAGDADTPKPLTEADIERIRSEERQRVFDENRKQGARNAYQNFIPNLREEMRKANVDPRLENWVAQKFTEYNGQVQQFAQEDVELQLLSDVGNRLVEAAGKHVPGIKKDDFKDSTTFINTVVAKAREGYIKESAVKPQIRSALKAYHESLIAKGALPASKGPPDDKGSGTAGKSKGTLDWALSAPIEDLLADR